MIRPVTTQRTLGIDLSSNPKKTAACLIAWHEQDDAKVEELIVGTSTPLQNKGLLELICRARLSGIDAPFGWPIPFVKAIRGWEASWTQDGKWPACENFETYRYRATDRQISDPRPPLSVSTDRIGVTAMRCAQVLAELGGKVDRSGDQGPVIEVYPAAALVHWGLPGEGYKKGAQGKEVRQKLVEDLCERLKSFCPLSTEHRELCEDNDDALDAVVASLVVRARLLKKTSKPQGADKKRARIEGWIHLPTCELEALAG
jgi:predicted nuclease with RNAse H fold